MLNCGHCGFDGPIEFKGDVQVESNTQRVDGYGEVEWFRKWFLYRCPVCKEPTLKGWWESEFTDFEFDEPIQIYPTPRDNSALPESVRKRYDAALKVRKTDAGFYAVGIGRMLEAVCRDRGKTKGDLNDRLDELVVDGVLPAPIGVLAHQIRSLRNFGAHDNDWDVEERDVPAIEDFAEVILEYLYRAPAQLDALRTSIEERQKAAKRPADSQPEDAEVPPG
jgi:hypothetical protein